MTSERAPAVSPAVLDALVETTRAGLTPFAEAVFATGDWLHALYLLKQRPDWHPHAMRLLDEAKLDDHAVRHEPKERCVLETLLVELVEEGDPGLARLDRLSRHPQLMMRAMFALLGAGPAGLDLAAGPPGHPWPDDDFVLWMRLRAAIVRGDPHEVVWGGSTKKKQAVLEAFQLGLKDQRSASPVPSETLLVRGSPWLGSVIDAYFDRALTKTAEAILWSLPKDRWQAEVAARKSSAKKTAPKPKKPKPPTKAELAKLDAELAAMRTALESIVRELRAAGFVFEGTPLEKPGAPAAKLKKLERLVGKVPLALVRFWAIVGGVDLRGNHPGWAKKTWVRTGDDPHWLADPLCVVSIAGALGDAEDGDFDVEDAALGARYALDLAGDDVTKANFSGGAVSVETPADVLDPPLVGAKGTFLGMLREAIRWRGFPGFAKVKGAPIRPRD